MDPKLIYNNVRDMIQKVQKTKKLQNCISQAHHKHITYATWHDMNENTLPSSFTPRRFRITSPACSTANRKMRACDSARASTAHQPASRQPLANQWPYPLMRHSPSARADRAEESTGHRSRARSPLGRPRTWGCGTYPIQRVEWVQDPHPHGHVEHPACVGSALLRVLPEAVAREPPHLHRDEGQHHSE